MNNNFIIEDTLLEILNDYASVVMDSSTSVETSVNMVRAMGRIIEKLENNGFTVEVDKSGKIVKTW